MDTCADSGSSEETHSRVFRAKPDELAGIDRGLRDSAEGRIATDNEVEAVFVKYRKR